MRVADISNKAAQFVSPLSILGSIKKKKPIPVKIDLIKVKSANNRERSKAIVN